jgi:hypothetical protein
MRTITKVTRLDHCSLSLLLVISQTIQKPPEQQSPTLCACSHLCVSRLSLRTYFHRSLTYPGDHPEMSTSSPHSMSGPEPKALRRSLRKLDAFLLVPVTVIYFLNFLDRYVYILLHPSTFLICPRSEVESAWDKPG